MEPAQNYNGHKTSMDESPHVDAATEQDGRADKADETVETANLEEALTISRTSYSRHLIHRYGSTEP